MSDKIRCLWCGSSMTEVAKFNKRVRIWCGRTCKNKHEMFSAKYVRILLQEGKLTPYEVKDTVNRGTSS